MAAKKERKPRTPKPASERKTHVVTDGVKAGQAFERIEKLEKLRDKKIADAPRALAENFAKKIAKELSALTPKQLVLTQNMRGIFDNIAPTEHDTKAEEAAQ